MVKELTKKDLIDEIDRLRQRVIDLEMEIIRLQNKNIWETFPVKPTFIPVIQPEWQLGDTTGGRPLLNQPLNLCTPVCQGGRGY